VLIVVLEGLAPQNLVFYFHRPRTLYFIVDFQVGRVFNRTHDIGWSVLFPQGQGLSVNLVVHPKPLYSVMFCDTVLQEGRGQLLSAFRCHRSWTVPACFDFSLQTLCPTAMV
jgi:hypothetical protein